MMVQSKLSIEKIRAGVRSIKIPVSVRQSSLTKSNMYELQLLLKNVLSKLDSLIERVGSLADRVENLTKRFDTYYSRMIGIETNIKKLNMKWIASKKIKPLLKS